MSARITTLAVIVCVAVAAVHVVAEESPKLNRLYERVDEALSGKNPKKAGELIARARDLGATRWRWTVAEIRTALAQDQYAQAAAIASDAYERAQDSEQRSSAANWAGGAYLSYAETLIRVRSPTCDELQPTYRQAAAWFENAVEAGDPSQYSLVARALEGAGDFTGARSALAKLVDHVRDDSDEAAKARWMLEQVVALIAEHQLGDRNCVVPAVLLSMQVATPNPSSSFIARSASVELVGMVTEEGELDEIVVGDSGVNPSMRVGAHRADFKFLPATLDGQPIRWPVSINWLSR